MSATLRTLPRLQVGSLLQWTDIVAAALALTAVARLSLSSTGSLTAAALTTVALSLTPFFDRLLAPPAALLTLAAAACAALPLAHDADHARRHHAAGALMTAAAALLSPPLLIPAMLLALALGLSARRSGSAAWIPGIVAVTLPLLVWLTYSTAAIESVPPAQTSTCLLPMPHGIRAAAGVAGAIVTEGGPYLLALAALGLFIRLWGRPPAGSIWLAAAAATAGLASGSPSARIVWLLVVSTFASLGIHEVLVATGARRLTAVGGIALVSLLPLLQLQRFAGRERSAPSAFGHQRLTTEAFLTFTRAIPELTLVREDASSDLVARAARKRLERLGKRPRLVARDAAAIRAAGAQQHTPILALPRAQAILRYRGITFERLPKAASVLTAVSGSRPCVAVTNDWTDLAGVAGGAQFALTADDEDGRGPVMVYVGSEDAAKPRPLDWPRASLRGFIAMAYTRAERPDLADALRAQGIPGTSPLLSAPHVVRITMWRTPGAPSVLPVTTAAPITAAVVRAERDAAIRGLEVCPSSAHEPATFD